MTTMPANLGAVLAKVAAQRAAAKQPTRKPRRTILAAAQREATFGRIPAAPVFPESNYWMTRHAFSLHELAVAGDVEAVRAYEIGGCNTYSRALRGYQALLLAVLEASAKVPAKAKAKAKPKAKAKAKGG